MYCCFGSRPTGFNPVPEISASVATRFHEQTQEINDVQKDLQKLPMKYRSCPAIRAVVVAALIVGICVAVVALNGQLTTFPQNFTAWIQNLNWGYVGIGFAGFVVLSVGAGFVIKRVKSLQNEITGSELGKVSGSDHWQEAYYIRENDDRFYYSGYIDTSTLDAEGNGTAFFYGNKNIAEHYYISSFIAATAPAHAATAIVYNIVRLVWIPFYILGSMAREAWNGEAIYPDQRPFEITDIPKQWWFSVKQIVKAPFYATAQLYAALYSYIDPLNGRKLGAAIERDWNNGIERSDGFWSVRGPQSSDWRLEGGGGPEKLGQNGFYAAGCWTPMGVVRFEEGQIVGGESMSKALHPEKGRNYHITTSDILRARHNAIVAQISQSQ